MQRLKFPKGFLWGAATSAYQTEGNNTNSDWWAWENSIQRQDGLRAKGLDPEDFKSGIACDSYHRFDEDFALAQTLGHTATRFSIEWSRIEPQAGKFNEKVLDHYEKVLQSAKFHGLKTFVALHHYTLPVWFAQKGAFTKKENVGYFVRYAEAVAKRLHEYADFWLTINEPEVYATFAYFFGVYPPQEKNPLHAWRVLKNLILAHNLSYPKLKFYGNRPVSLAYHLSDIQPVSVFSELLVSLAHHFANDYVLNKTANSSDFIGVNYYFHHHLGWLGHRHRSRSGHEVNDLGWGIHPEGLERVLVSLKKYQKPVYITENGIADARDQKREKFIKDHLWHIHHAIQKGSDVRGYLYWSLIDNFEWEKGFGPRFGLIEIDYEDLLRRRVRHSAIKYAEICRNNYLEI